MLAVTLEQKNCFQFSLFFENLLYNVFKQKLFKIDFQKILGVNRRFSMMTEQFGVVIAPNIQKKA